ncbi:hypothetical protein [Prescottella subtropica]|uniref:hypothetical protein n=1 Tax=Prescottella subtropica TaxID=2545757 RepID=UPI0010F669EC|nr:hypothetical protein [Prescottella subtropica]
MTATLTPDQVTRIDRYIRDTGHDIDGLLRAQQTTIGHVLAVLACAAHPGVGAVRIYDIDEDGRPGHIQCTFVDRPEAVPLAANYSGLEDALVAMLRRLPDCDNKIWSRLGRNAALDVSAALAAGNTYPLRTVGERIIEDLEKAVGCRSIRKAEITTEEFDNGFYPNDIVEVDFCDGDSDEVYVEGLADYTDELREMVAGFGRDTIITITNTATGITIE